MSIAATHWAWTQENLRPARKLVLLALADRAGRRHTCWPSLARLAVDTGLNPKTIRAALADLCAAGLISREATPGRSHTYTLCRVADWLAEKTTAAPGEKNEGRLACADASSSQAAGPIFDAAITPPGETALSEACARASGQSPISGPNSIPAPSAAPAGISPPCPKTPPGPAQNTPRPCRLRPGRGAENGSLTSQEPDMNRTGNRKNQPRPRKQPFGRFGNVLLTPEERRSLASEHGEKAARAIDKLDLWLGAHGDRYKSHYMAIQAWALRAVDEDDARAALAARSNASGLSPALAGASAPEAAPAILPATYAHIERANQKSVARLALLGRGVTAHGRQTSHYHGIDPDPDPVQPPRG